MATDCQREQLSYVIGTEVPVPGGEASAIQSVHITHVEENGVPVTLVISQLVITSIALIILTNTGGGNNMSFLIALALTVVIYLCAYFMLFIEIWPQWALPVWGLLLRERWSVLSC